MTKPATNPQTCRKCHQSKPAAAFSPGRCVCRTCRSAQDAARRAARIEQYRAAHRDYQRSLREANPEKARQRSQVRDANRRARETGTAGQITVAEWREIMAHYAPDGRCPACGQAAPLTIDHVVPISAGGENTARNIQPACEPCNKHKHSRTIDYRPDRGLFARRVATRPAYLE